MNYSNQIKKIVCFFPEALAITAVFLLVLRSLTVADTSWDTLSYHLPFSALRAGLLSHQNFVLPEHLAASYYGFPSAIYYLKGWLWSFTTRAESAQLISIISIIIFLLYAKRTLLIPASWVCIGILTIPAIQIGSSGNMTDVPANIGMAMMFLSLYKLITHANKLNNFDLFWLAFACLITSGSKPQAVVVGGFLFFAYSTTFIFLMATKAIKYSESLTKSIAVFWLVLCAFIISYPAIINIYNYWNPIYPMKLDIGSLHLKGVFEANNWSDPQYLNSLPQQFKWLLSVLELHAYDFRAIPYTVDQGSVPLDAKSFRMGGYFSPLILMSLFVITLLTFKKTSSKHGNPLLLLSCVTIFISSLPGSNELRYYSFWAVSIVVIAIDQLESNKHIPEIRGVLLSYKAFLIFSFTFIVLITGGEYFRINGVSYSNLTNNFSNGKKVLSTVNGITFCYKDDYRGAIFDSAAFSDHANVVIINKDNSICKEGNSP